MLIKREEVSDDFLISLIEQVSLKPQYTRYLDYVIFPMPVDEVWDRFFGDDAEYNFNETFELMGDPIRDLSMWDETDPSKVQIDGAPISMHRRRKIASKAPPNPIITYFSTT